MIDIQGIKATIESALAGIAAEDGAGLFLVEARVLPGDDIEVFIDSDGRGTDGRLRGVSVEDCAALTRAIRERLDNGDEGEDFSLTVSSAGIGQPLRVVRQYRKLVGGTVEVVTTVGAKITGVLERVEAGAKGATGADGTGDANVADGALEGVSITLSYPEKQKIEGKKKPEIVTVTKTFPLTEIKTTKEYIDFT